MHYLLIPVKWRRGGKKAERWLMLRFLLGFTQHWGTWQEKVWVQNGTCLGRVKTIKAWLEPSAELRSLSTSNREIHPSSNGRLGINGTKTWTFSSFSFNTTKQNLLFHFNFLSPPHFVFPLIYWSGKGFTASQLSGAADLLSASLHNDTAPYFWEQLYVREQLYCLKLRIQENSVKTPLQQTCLLEELNLTFTLPSLTFCCTVTQQLLNVKGSGKRGREGFSITTLLTSHLIWGILI